jgi:glutamine amidotransferase
MCRFLTYIGRPVSMHDLLYSPKNSLIKQSINAHEQEEPLNGDGFGIAWYDHTLDETPAVYTSIRPAWNDRNLTSLSKKIRSELFFAHVRAASTGEVSESNCHPFQFKKYLFMHNGGIEDFPLIKRFLRRELSDEIYNWLRGQTDSEHLFALFLHRLYLKYPNDATPLQMAQVMHEAIERVVELKNELGLESDNYINMAVSDGKNLVALRYVTNVAEDASTLYYSEGSRYECSEGVCRMRSLVAGEPHSVLIVSEKLTNVVKDWKEVPTNHFIIVNEQHEVTLVDYHQINGQKDLKKSA